jgi:diguanylate cyclase (GGDEF)-like protein
MTGFEITNGGGSRQPVATCRQRECRTEVAQDPTAATGIAQDDDHEVRRLLQAGRLAEANAEFDLVLSRRPTPPDHLHRAAMLVSRAVLAWRLNRVPLALELAAEGWTDLSGRPQGAAAATALSSLGYLLEGVGHRQAALETLRLSVRLARAAEDEQVLARCLQRLGGLLNLQAIDGPPAQARPGFAEAKAVLAEGLRLCSDDRWRRRLLGAYGRALAGVGEWAAAAHAASEVLALATEADDRWGVAVGQWVLAIERWHHGRLAEAGALATEAMGHAEAINDPSLLLRLSLDVADICAARGDRAGEAAALRRSVSAVRRGAETSREGLGQALEQRRLAVQAQRLATAAQEAAAQDPLTGVANRLGLQRSAPALLDDAVRAGRLPALVLVDVDGFKGVNDHAGHAVGDAALCRIAQLLLRECRLEDLVARWAGDEFVILLGGADATAGPTVAERIRVAVADHDWTPVLGPAGRPTVSIGVACGPGDLDTLFVAADIALYQAKRQGRNRVAVYRPLTGMTAGAHRIGDTPS